ncbi:uncharacterized protein znf541 isoform X2 [Silurus meridionalis]|uniref:uncharacterized protein znf541 isoform X2 n=1 Tax=Silurus meridionalis TaxID=175797 RepID=UPI001EE9C3AC|nr:uncharacterized protein znf541 isoform X2 [Silurus meridionalis]
MEVMESSDINLPLLSESENLPDGVIVISPLTPSLASLPAQQQQLWVDTECEVSTNTEGMQRGKVAHKCSKCSKVFETRYTLHRHLLTHQPERSHACNVCQKKCKRHDLLIGHMLTHKKKKDYRCSHVGCQKMYCGYKSLQRHCATQHGASLLPSFTRSSSINTQTCPPLLEPPTLPAVKDGASTSNDFHSYLFPTKPRSAFQFEGYTGCGTSYTNYTLSGNPTFSCNPQDSNLSKLKLSEIPQSWSLTADGASCSFDSAVGLSESHSTEKSNQWASTAILGGSVVGPEEPETVHTWECNSQQGVLTNFQAQKEAPTRQPNKGIRMRMCCQPSSAFTRNSQADLLKLNMRPHEPQNNQQVPLMRGVASCSKLNIVGSSAHQIEPIIPSLSPATKIKKKRLQKILKPANIPTPPLPSPKPTTQRRPRACTADLVSPSQVAMASFSKKTAPADTLKGGSATAKARKGKESGERIYLKYPPRKHEQFSPSCPQVPTTSCKIDQLLMDPISTPKFGGVGMAGFCYQADREVQQSPLVIPVSVPVSSKEATLSKTSDPTIEKQHNVKKSRHPGHLQNLITPVQVAGGYPSQLRSPIYLADHLLNFDPPPYTPPPMLSPLRTGTGLYFNTLPQCQPSFPPPNIYSSFLDGKDGISLILDNTVTNIEPKINVGSRFQAEIPPLRNPLLILYDEHPADLTWAPWGDLPSNPKTQQKVTEFLAMCCSSVLPGGGTNTELALHCLHEVQGDILAALDLLLVRGDYRTSCHPLSDYHYTGSDHWTAQEMRLFQKTLLKQTKDFQLIHQMLQTKSVAQCVEYYYAMKKVKKFKQHWRAIKKAGDAGKNPESRRVTVEQYGDKTGGKKSLNTPKGKLIGYSTKNWEYTCEECGRSGNIHYDRHFPFYYIFSFGFMKSIIYTLPPYVHVSGVFIKQGVSALT